MEQAAESETTNEAISNDNQTETQAETTTTDNTQKPSNPEREWVDPAIDPPEKVKERLDFLYGKVKKTEREQGEWRRLAADQAAVIEELRQATGQVVNHLTQKSFTDSSAELEDQMMTALQTGDTKSYLTAQNKLIDLKTQQRLAEQQRLTSPVKKQQIPNTASQIAAQGGMDYNEQSTIDAWQGERDEHGSNLRPWAQNSGSEDNPDPDYIKAVLVARNIFTNDSTAHWTINQKLAEIDKRMGVKKTGGAQNVMGGGLTSKPKTGRITLSPQVEKMAIRTKFGGPKAKSDAEHIEAYRKQIEKVRSKGAR